MAAAKKERKEAYYERHITKVKKSILLRCLCSKLIFKSLRDNEGAVTMIPTTIAR